jgi:hypothetical protein
MRVSRCDRKLETRLKRRRHYDGHVTITCYQASIAFMDILCYSRPPSTKESSYARTKPLVEDISWSSTHIHLSGGRWMIRARKPLLVPGDHWTYCSLLSLTWCHGPMRSEGSPGASALAAKVWTSHSLDVASTSVSIRMSSTCGHLMWEEKDARGSYRCSLRR